MGADRVDVEAGAIEHEAATLSGFKDVVAGVLVNRAQPKLIEDVIFDGLDCFFGIQKRPGFIHEGSKLGFHPKDTLTRLPAHSPILRPTEHSYRGVLGQGDLLLPEVHLHPAHSPEKHKGNTKGVTFGAARSCVTAPAQSSLPLGRL